MNLGESKEVGEGLVDFFGGKAIGVSKHPFGFQQDRVGNENRFFLQDTQTLPKLGFVISHEETDQDVCVNADHRNAPPRL